MSFTYPLSLPSSPVSRHIRLIAVTNAAMTRSVFTGEQQITEHQGQWWEAEYELPPMERDDAEPWLSILLALAGRVGTFKLGDPNGKSPRGTATAATVNGAGQTGKTLALSGTGTLKAGDYLQVGSGTSQRLYKNLKDLTLPATADIFPRLRESPSNGASVTLTNTTGIFRLAEPRFEWDLDTAKLYGISFKAIEAI